MTIKKIALYLTSLSALFAMETARAQVYIAPEAGATFGQVNTKLLKDFYYTDVSTKPQLSYQGGIGFQVFLNRNLAIQTGVFYKRLSYNDTYYNDSYPNLAYPSTISYHIHYGQIALSLSYFHQLGNTGSAFAGLGGYAMNAFAAKTGAGVDLSLGNGSDNFLKPVDAGALAYLGYQFRFGGFLRLQYAHGLVNLSTEKEYYSNYGNSLSLTMGFRLRMKTRQVESKHW